ncbi:hypothetical protein MKK68_03845 [Methylobacterium sp. E-016]|uniref:hypothetical protein n=1 Tax=Methylobacterium sp. E-016 TaxID=2836556 RepID=UPI001FBA0D69|nr:hypothetical protein [Methylobacterium sp. E-016]MCJ2074784.1 hypothetical protein [Methylobacterium sp. E-016]
MMRRLALSYWTPIGAGLVLLSLHLAWAIRWEPSKRGEVVTGFGACLIVLGLLIAARPYIRSGMRHFVDAEVGPPPADRLRDYLAAQTQIPKIVSGELMYLVDGARYASKRAEVRRDVLAERAVAVVVIAAGTLLNGYGPLLVRLAGWEVQP